jgi:hypothetical protein
MRSTSLSLLVAALVAGALSFACAADTAGTVACVPGRQVECACEDGTTGVQVCNEDSMSYSACMACGSAGSSGSWGSGGSSGSWGSGGSSTGGSGGSSGSGGGAGTAGASGSGGGTPFNLNDSLKDNQPKGNPVGGSFGPDGWTVTAKTDRIWYAVPRLVEGSIQFTVSGITHANLNLADHEIFSMYDAGHGIPEPINYNPEFRDNHYKQLIRIYGQMVPERLGEQKFIMLMCPDGAPGYGACACGKSFYDGDGWWGGNPAWDGSATTIKVTWGNGKATYSRDGVDVWTNDYTASGLDFGPSELHFTIGCPRHDAIGDAGMPIGAVFSDVIAQGIDGSIETCN